MGTMRLLMAETLGFMQAGWTWDLFDIQGCSLMDTARNLMVSTMLGRGFDDIIMIDDDVVWEPGALIKLLNKPVDLVAASYRHRADPETYPVRWLEDRDELWADPETGLLEVEGVATGCLRISRAAALRLTEAAEWYNDSRAPEGRSWRIFGRILDDEHNLYGEDYSLCKLWRSIGGKVWLDPEIRMGHIGFKTFEGKIGDWLRGRLPAISEAA